MTPATLSLLRDRPGFADAVADRGWRAWWAESGKPLADYRAHLDPMMAGDGLPQALVAHRGDAYLGSVLLIASDLDARPALTPWIAALWVEPPHRRQGLAARLIRAARGEAARLGHPACFLCATPDKGPYYEAQGFRPLERGAEGLDVFTVPALG